MNLILLEPGDVDTSGVAVLRESRARHVVRVLGAKPGDSIRVGVIDGPMGGAEVLEVSDREVKLRCVLDGGTPPMPAVDLLLALPRPKVLKRLWAQLAALGVGRIILTNAAKVERNYFDTHVLDEDFYRPLLIEGLQQARDTRLPRVSIHRRFRPLIEDELDSLSDAGVRLVADPSGTESIRAAVTAKGDERVLLAVGPEGGWVPFELELFQARGFVAVGMGPRTLRTDTACVALLALVNEALRA
jgi:RsmE family RNA methyltransferase